MQASTEFSFFLKQVAYLRLCLCQVRFERYQKCLGRGFCEFLQLGANAAPESRFAAFLKQLMAGIIDPVLGTPASVTSRIVPSKHRSM